ncbi:MAG: winged helix-turn-helix domain-containing protein, partial [Eubacteriales bacterium]
QGTRIPFTQMEFYLLLYLVRHRNKAISRDELLNKIWGFETETETRATDDMIKRIRKKLASIGSKLQIETIWGFGFIIIDKNRDS